MGAVVCTTWVICFERKRVNSPECPSDRRFLRIEASHYAALARSSEKESVYRINLSFGCWRCPASPSPGTFRRQPYIAGRPESQVVAGQELLDSGLPQEQAQQHHQRQHPPEGNDSNGKSCRHLDSRSMVLALASDLAATNAFFQEYYEWITCNAVFKLFDRVRNLFIGGRS